MIYLIAVAILILVDLAFLVADGLILYKYFTLETDDIGIKKKMKIKAIVVTCCIFLFAYVAAYVAKTYSLDVKQDTEIDLSTEELPSPLETITLVAIESNGTIYTEGENIELIKNFALKHGVFVVESNDNIVNVTAKNENGDENVYYGYIYETDKEEIYYDLGQGYLKIYLPKQYFNNGKE